MKHLLRISSAVCLAFTIGSSVGYADTGTLEGSTVTATLYNPDLSTVLGGPTTAIVGASTPTFPPGSIFGNSLFDINITAVQVFYSPLSNVTYGNGLFNGFVFDFSGAPTILDVTLDPASTFTPSAISFTGNSISLNLSGNTVNTGSVAILDVSLVPEPSSGTLMILPIGLVGLICLWPRPRSEKNLS